MNTRIEDTLSSLSKSLGKSMGWPGSWPVITRASKRRSPLTYAAIAGAGVATGVGLGLLLVPQSGKELRGEVVQRARSLRDTVSAQFERASRAVSETAGAITEGTNDKTDKTDKTERAERSDADVPNHSRPQGTVRA